MQLLDKISCFDLSQIKSSVAEILAFTFIFNDIILTNDTQQDLVSSLEKKIDETQRKYEETNKISEERLKQALDAESKIIQLKTDMQRFLQSLIYIC